MKPILIFVDTKKKVIALKDLVIRLGHRCDIITCDKDFFTAKATIRHIQRGVCIALSKYGRGADLRF